MKRPDPCVCSEHKNMVPRAWLLLLVGIVAGVLGYITRASASAERVDGIEVRVDRLERGFDSLDRTLREQHRETLDAIRAAREPSP